ncbi:S35C2-like protein [Mya arenaria]|uniref:S35C2-like protein n=1 Tax=Mya arenaria TaxID=6604 RepID=A0ABY7EWW0_MYAAR|nr:solute carrier family 35 member C2-like [Mya arenaria]XP_052815922.1 solute carrier family 35 member C2-like [Mya arenaria]XP_052815923.1 solute carrier family 35 member C2-like [Mya arenaria]XP_052815924.1 solute carrier family 35 member C2-like [Mya arenaria]XP_052816439.1 solute carrier family 35 member C2-like [Mya arenaria]XP_052816441.1 solute carrier family 35 member C2-like [Mya arenaria]WAR13013.1 S35C2-like protein [Mya arenaria]
MMTQSHKTLRDLETAAHLKLVKLRTSVGPEAEKVKKSLISVAFVTLAVKTVFLVLFYYVFSIGLTFYNQRFIKHWNYPLSLTMAHLLFKFSLSAVVRVVMELVTKKPRVVLPWGPYCKRVAPAGITSALDIGLSNWSFEFITVSLYTMSKSSAVIFILMFAVIMRLEKWRWSLLFVVLFIATGLFMFTYHSTQFNLEGFSMVMTASVLSGLRWTLAQVVMQKNELGLHHPLDTMYHIQPWMIVGLIPLSIAFEGVPLATTDQFFRFNDYEILLRNCSLVLLGAFLAFMLEFSEFLLLSQTSSLTLSISGIFKELCTLLLAHMINGDTMNAVNGVGLFVCLLGIILHVVLKALHRQETSSPSQNGAERIRMLNLDNTANISEDDEDEIFNVRDR